MRYFKNNGQCFKVNENDYDVEHVKQIDSTHFEIKYSGTQRYLDSDCKIALPNNILTFEGVELNEVDYIKELSKHSPKRDLTKEQQDKYFPWLVITHRSGYRYGKCWRQYSSKFIAEVVNIDDYDKVEFGNTCHELGDFPRFRTRRDALNFLFDKNNEHLYRHMISYGVYYWDYPKKE